MESFLNLDGLRRLWAQIQNKLNSKANSEDVLIKQEQTLTDDELSQVRKNLKFIGKDADALTVEQIDAICV